MASSMETDPSAFPSIPPPRAPSAPSRTQRAASRAAARSSGNPSPFASANVSRSSTPAPLDFYQNRIIDPLLCSLAHAVTAIQDHLPPTSRTTSPPPQAPELASIEAAISNLSARVAPLLASSTPSYAKAANTIAPAPPTAIAPSKEKGRGRKPHNAPAASAVAEAVSTTPIKKHAPLPSAARRMFATRNILAPYPASGRIIASLPDIAAYALRDANCHLPLSFTAFCNSKGSVSLLVNSPYTPAAEYSPFFNLLTARLNQSFPMGENPYLPFRLAPNESQLIIHGIPLEALPPSADGLFKVMHAGVRNTCKVSILSARFLQPDAEKRAAGSATSIVVVINPEDSPKLGENIRLFSGRRSITQAHSSNKFTQCHKCLHFGHVQATCKAPQPSCPLCAKNHSRSEHRCANLGCPNNGHLKPVSQCCIASPLLCVLCNNSHTAYDRSCPNRPAPQPFTPQDVTMQNMAPPPPPPEQPIHATPRQRFFEGSTVFAPRPRSNTSRFGGALTFDTEDALKNALFNPVPLPAQPPQKPHHGDDEL